MARRQSGCRCVQQPPPTSTDCFPLLVAARLSKAATPMRMRHADQQTILAAGETTLRLLDNPTSKLSNNKSYLHIDMLANEGSRVSVNRSRYCILRTKNSFSALITKNARQSTDLLRPYLRMLTDEQLMPSGCPMKGLPCLLCHPGAASRGRGFLALRVSSPAMTTQNRAGSRISRLLLFNVVGRTRVPSPKRRTAGGFL